MANIIAHIPMVIAAVLAPWAFIASWARARHNWHSLIAHLDAQRVEWQ